jgi:hypothetical protein
MSKEPMKEPSGWMLGVGLTLILGAFVLLLFIPENSWGY